MKTRYPVTGDLSSRLCDFPEKTIVKRFFILFSADVSIDTSDITVGTVILLLGLYPANTLVIKFVIELVDKQGYPVKIEF